MASFLACMLSTRRFASATFLARSGSRFGFGRPGTGGSGRDDDGGGGGGGVDGSAGGFFIAASLARNVAWIEAMSSPATPGGLGSDAGGATASGSGRNDGVPCCEQNESVVSCAVAVGEGRTELLWTGASQCMATTRQADETRAHPLSFLGPPWTDCSVSSPKMLGRFRSPPPLGRLIVVGRASESRAAVGRPEGRASGGASRRVALSVSQGEAVVVSKSRQTALSFLAWN